MGLVERMYRSPLGRFMSVVARWIALLHKPFMVYGFVDPVTRQFRKYARVSSSTLIISPEKLSVAEDVWVWHHSIIDASEGVELQEGAQVGAWVGLFSHGSENSVRLLGRQYVHVPFYDRPGYTRGKVTIGAYSYLAPSVMVLPGVTIGKGCVIGAGSIVTRDIPDYSLAFGSPAKVRGSTLDLDAEFFKNADFSGTYFDPDALARVREKARSLSRS